MKKIKYLVFLFLAAATLSNAFAQDGPPRKSSADAKSDYEKTHYPATNYNNASYAPKNNSTSVERTRSSSTTTNTSTTTRTSTSNPYSYIGKYVDGLANVCLGGEWGCIDESGEKVVPLKYAEPLVFVDGISIASKDINFGYGSHSQYDVPTKILRYGYVNNSGWEIVPTIYNKASSFSEGLAVVSVEGSLRIVDKNGKITSTNVIYNQSRSFREGLCAVQSYSSFWGFINTKGVLVVPMIYDEEEDFKNGKTKVLFNGKTLFFDKTGREVIENETITERTTSVNIYEDRVSSYAGGPISVKFKGKWGLLDTSNKAITAFKYDKALYINSDLVAEVTMNGKKGYINIKGEEVIPPIYESLELFNAKLRIAILNGKSGLYERNGKLVLPVIYDEISKISYGGWDAQIFKIKVNDKFGWVDSTGTEILPPIYENVNYFRNGLFPVKLDGKWGVIEKNGNVVINFKYDLIYSFEKVDIYGMKVGDKFGFLNSVGEEIIAPIYDETVYDGKDNIHLKLGGKDKYFDYKGKKIRN